MPLLTRPSADSRSTTTLECFARRPSFLPEAPGRSLRHDNLAQKDSVIAAACGTLIMESGG